MPTGCLIEQYVNWMDIVVGFGSSNFSFLQRKRDIKLTLVPKSLGALSIGICPMEYGIEKLLGSCSFDSDLCCRAALHISPMTPTGMFSGSPFSDRSPLKNFR